MGRHRLDECRHQAHRHRLRFDDDRLEVYNATNSARLPLGSVDLGRSDYVLATFGFGSITLRRHRDSLDDDD